MTAAWDCTDNRQALGVYVLGAIDPAERSQVDKHVTGCRECRDEMPAWPGCRLCCPGSARRKSAASRARTPSPARRPGSRGRFRRVPREPDRGPAPPEPALAGRRGRRRGGGRRGRPAPRVQPGPGPSVRDASIPPASWQTARTTSALHGITATVRYNKEPWGTAMDIQVSGVPDGTTCQLWVTDSQGVHLAAAGLDRGPR